MSEPPKKPFRGDDWNGGYGVPSPRNVTTDTLRLVIVNKDGKPIRRAIGFVAPEHKDRR